MADTLVYARVPLPGYNKKVRDRGEIFNLISGRNDEKLIGLRYILPFDPKQHKQIQCDTCGSKFINQSFYEDHKRKKDCKDYQGEPTRAETAELIGADVDKLVVDNDRTNQRVFTTE